MECVLWASSVCHQVREFILSGIRLNLELRYIIYLYLLYVLLWKSHPYRHSMRYHCGWTVYNGIPRCAIQGRPFINTLIWMCLRVRHTMKYPYTLRWKDCPYWPSIKCHYGWTVYTDLPLSFTFILFLSLSPNCIGPFILNLLENVTWEISFILTFQCKTIW